MYVSRNICFKITFIFSKNGQLTDIKSTCLLLITHCLNFKIEEKMNYFHTTKTDK